MKKELPTSFLYRVNPPLVIGNKKANTILKGNPNIIDIIRNPRFNINDITNNTFV
jgi:hypothetical protein